MDAKDEPLSPLALWILRAHHEIRHPRLTAPVSYPSHGWGHRDGFKARLLLELARRGLGFARRFGGESPTLQAKVNPPSGGTP